MLEAISMLSFSTVCRRDDDTGNILFSEMGRSDLEMHTALFLKYDCLLILYNKCIQLRPTVSLFSVIE